MHVTWTPLYLIDACNNKDIVHLSLEHADWEMTASMKIAILSPLIEKHL